MNRKQRVCLTIQKKLEILKKLEEGTSTKTEIAEQYGIHRTTVTKLEKEKDKIVKLSLMKTTSLKKQMKYASEGRFI